MHCLGCHHKQLGELKLYTDSPQTARPRQLHSRVYVSDYYDSKYNFLAQQSRFYSYDECENVCAICGLCLFMGYICVK